jgi:hypothetical protein
LSRDISWRGFLLHWGIKTTSLEEPSSEKWTLKWEKFVKWEEPIEKGSCEKSAGVNGLPFHPRSFDFSGCHTESPPHAS